MTVHDRDTGFRMSDGPSSENDAHELSVAAEMRVHAEQAGPADRMPGWLLRSLGALTALVALWFALAFLGGIPAGPVEWLTLAILGAFAYSLAVTVPLLVSLLAGRVGRQ